MKTKSGYHDLLSRKIHLKIWSAQRQPFCSGLNMLTLKFEFKKLPPHCLWYCRHSGSKNNGHINVFQTHFQQHCPTHLLIYIKHQPNCYVSMKCFLKCASYDLTVLGLYSLSGRTSYHKISGSLEAARFGCRLFQSIWNLTGTTAVHIGSSAVEMPVQFQSVAINLTPNLAPSRLHEIWRKDLPFSE